MLHCGWNPRLSEQEASLEGWTRPHPQLLVKKTTTIKKTHKNSRGHKDLFIILYQRVLPETAVSQMNTALCFTYSCIHGNEGRKIKRIEKSNQNKNVHQIWTTYKNRS